jgi:hypothetical protein
MPTPRNATPPSSTPRNATPPSSTPPSSMGRRSMSHRSTGHHPTSPSSPDGLGLEDAHEWVSFEDPSENRTWVVDVTWLESRWECIYGRGCQGVLTGPTPELEQGCCSYGAHFTGEEDAERVATVALTLTADQWQYRNRGRSDRGVLRTTKKGEIVTRLADGACIFLNRPGFPGGAGCALHRAALELGVSPVELKPDVCWQLPLRRNDEIGPDGHVVSTLTEWRRRDWGEGGHEFAWWCTEAPEAFGAARPVYETLRDEIVAMIGEDIYVIISRHLDERRRRPVVLPHPAVRGQC